jgi:hypothetical protein
MLSVKSRFRLNIRNRKLAFAFGAVLACGALAVCEVPQAAAAPANFKVTDKIPDANPCKKDDAARHDALKKAAKAVLASKVAEKINENIEAAVKGKGVSIATDVDVELAADWQTYQKIFSEASGDKLTDSGAQSDFGTNAVISRDASKNGHKQIKVVFFCNTHLQEAFTQKKLPRIFVRALANAEARAITFTGIAKADLPAGYSTGEDAGQNGKFDEHADALLKLVPDAGGNGKEAAKTAEAAKPKGAEAPKPEIATKVAEAPKPAAGGKTAEAVKPPVKAPEASKPAAPAKAAGTDAKPAKPAATEAKKKDETKKLAETQPLPADKAGAKKAADVKAKPAKETGSQTTIKKSAEPKAAKADAAKATDKGPKLKAKAKRRHHVSHRHHKRHVIKHKRRHRHIRHEVCPFGFSW